MPARRSEWNQALASFRLRLGMAAKGGNEVLTKLNLG